MDATNLPTVDRDMSIVLALRNIDIADSRSAIVTFELKSAGGNVGEGGHTLAMIRQEVPYRKNCEGRVDYDGIAMMAREKMLAHFQGIACTLRD